MTNKEILEFLKEYALEKYKWIITKPEEFYELLNEETIVFDEMGYSSRHWQEMTKVAKIKDVYIQFESAYTTDDMTAYEKGWKFDLDSIREVKQHVETIEVVTYK